MLNVDIPIMYKTDGIRFNTLKFYALNYWYKTIKLGKWPLHWDTLHKVEINLVTNFDLFCQLVHPLKFLMLKLLLKELPTYKKTNIIA